MTWKKYSQPIIYIILAILYRCIGDIFGGNQLITLPVHGLYLLLTIYYIYRCFKDCTINNVIKITAIIFVINLIYGIALMLSEGNYIQSSNYITKYFNSIASIFVFYYFSEKGLIDEKWLAYIAILFCAVVYLQYYYASHFYSIEYGMDIGDFTDNSGYLFLGVMPAIVFLKKKPLLMYLSMIYLTIMILLCAKRGAILICAIIDIYYIFKMSASTKRKFSIVLLSAGLIFVLWHFIDNLMVSNDFFQARVNQTINGSSSNRDLIYSRIWDIFINKNSIIGYIFGNGALAVGRLTGYMAHNDWLEIALSMGLLGILLYYFYFRIQIITCIKAKSSGVNSMIIMAFTSFIIMNLMKTFFSMSLDNMTIYFTSIMGYCFSQCNSWNINNNCYEKE